MTTEMERALREQSERFHDALNARSEKFHEDLNAQTDEFCEALNAQTDMFSEAIMKQTADLRAQMRSNRWWTVGTMIAVGLALAALIIGVW